MKTFKFRLALLALLACVAAALPPFASQTSARLQKTTTVQKKTHARLQRRTSVTTSTSSTREDAYRANNIGVALLEQFKYNEGAEAFRRALRIEPELALAQINLGIALYNLPDAAGAQRESEAAAAIAPGAPQPFYILGLIAKSQNRADDAIAAFRRVLKLDPADVGANVSLGQVYAQQRNYPEAIAAFRTALAAEPYNGTALYNLGTALLRTGQREEGQHVIARFQELRKLGSGTTIGQNYLEQGRYAEAVASTGAEPELIDRRTPPVVFTDATASVLPPSKESKASVSGASHGELFYGGKSGEKSFGDWGDYLGGGVLLFDFDGDGDLDLFCVAAPGRKLYRNDGGKFT
ncbi:MAG: hypothetical protein QOC61_811, partial [Acidobacteriota bacterium]|nr:hypothetical protein [Acidobacteriota bacterium]